MRPQSSTIPHHHLAPNKGVQPLSLLALHIQIYYLRQLVSWGEKCGGVDTYKPKLQSHPLLQQKSCPGSKPLIFFSPPRVDIFSCSLYGVRYFCFLLLTISQWEGFLGSQRAKSCECRPLPLLSRYQAIADEATSLSLLGLKDWDTAEDT